MLHERSYTGLATVIVLLVTGCASNNSLVTKQNTKADFSCSDLADRIEESRPQRLALGLSPVSDGKEFEWKDFTRPPKPDYPISALRQKRQSHCDILFDVDAKGVPENLGAICTYEEFVPYALKAVRNMRVRPFEFDGKSVAVPGVIYPINFYLDDIKKEHGPACDF